MDTQWGVVYTILVIAVLLQNSYLPQTFCGVDPP